MKRWLLTLASAAVLSVSLAGCGGSSDTPAADNTSASGSADTQQVQEQQPEAPASDYAVTIDGAQLSSDYDGKPAVVVTYTFTNNSDEATAFLTAIDAEVYQNGVQCDTAIMTDVDTSASMNKIKPGASTQVLMAYSLTDESDIEVEVYELFSIDSAPLVTQTFSLA